MRCINFVTNPTQLFIDFDHNFNVLQIYVLFSVCSINDLISFVFWFAYSFPMFCDINNFKNNCCYVKFILRQKNKTEHEKSYDIKSQSQRQNDLIVAKEKFVSCVSFCIANQLTVDNFRKKPNYVIESK